MSTQKIIPHLWFDKNAEEAVKFYTSLFKGGKILNTTRYTEAGKDIHGMDAGEVMTVNFQIEGYNLIALNGGPLFKFTPAISFMVNCTTKDEVDDLWSKLSVGGTALMPLDAYPFSERYGWIQDTYGLTWQLIYTDKIPQRKIVPSLMFAGEQAGKAEEAMNFYISLFEDSRVGQIARYGADQAPDTEGTVMYADFTLAGQIFAAMDSAQAHAFTFNEAISLLVTCKDQEEIDHFWNALSAVPESEQCGWLKDRYGVSWQIAPEGMEQILNTSDTEKARKAMDAVLSMKKFDIAKLKEAVEE